MTSTDDVPSQRLELKPVCLSSVQECLTVVSKREPDRAMDLHHLISLKIVFFLLGALTINTSGQICSAPSPVLLKENNTADFVVTTITSDPGVSLEIINNPENAFGINGSALVAKEVLDYEALPDVKALSVTIQCKKDGAPQLTITVSVIVKDINDNQPVFEKEQYNLSVNELSKIGTPVGKIQATDLDIDDQLFYQLISPMGEFELQTATNPEILVKKQLDYDQIKTVTLKLFAQDTSLFSTLEPSHTASTTVIVTILDINNRPPWFKPCTVSTNVITKVCFSTGYTGHVKLNETQTGALTLKPGPVYAIDGDNGRNDAIGYEIIGGNEDQIFTIDENSGNITIVKPVGVAGPIILTVMAFELENPDQFATTTVTLDIVISSNNPPQFVKENYEGFISEDAGVGSLVLESKSKNIPLQVQATDPDFFNGVNPDIQFEAPTDSDFKIISEGFIIMTRAAVPGTLTLQIKVIDTKNYESSTASLSVEVIPGVTTTEMSTTTNSSTTTAITTNMTTGSTTVKVTQLTESTSSPHTITTNPETTRSPYTEGLTLPSGDFRTEDMVALGVSLAIALLLCFVAIGFLAHNLRRFHTDWKKLSEVSIFRSSLGSGGPKDGVAYTNESFHTDEDEDKDSMTSKQAAELKLPRGPDLSRQVPDVLEKQRSVPTVQNMSNNDNAALPKDLSSQNASDHTDNEKEVKPILTKERRMEEGYKAVWFKEDIDPNDKKEVVISDGHEDIDDDFDGDQEEEEEEKEKDDL